METSSFQIPAPKLHDLQKKVRAWSRKATKAGLSGLDIQVSEDITKVNYVVLTHKYDDAIIYRTLEGFDPSLYTRYDITGYQCREYHTVTLPTTLPSFDGFRLISVLDHTCKQANIIAQVDREIETPEQYRSTGSFCDHCNTKRRRNTTLVLLGPEGDFKQVGKSCVKLYLQSDVNALVAMAEMWPEICALGDEYDMNDSDWSGGCSVLLLEEYLCRVSSCIRTCGWMARSSGSENPTANMALSTKVPFEDQDKAIASSAIDWARNLVADNNFLSNMKALAHEDVISPKHVGTAAYVVQGYLKHIGQEKVRQDREAQPKSVKWLGETGEKITFAGVVTRFWTAEYRDDYGNYRAMAEITTDDGSKAVWWTTTSSRLVSYVSTVGNVVKVSARIKDCSEYKDQKQTVVSRPRIDLIEEAC